MHTLSGIGHVTYLVWDLAGVERYFAEHFDLQAVRADANSFDLAVGPTVLRFVRPTHPATREYDLLRRAGVPAVSLIGFTVDELDETVASLRHDGIAFLQPHPVQSRRDGRRLIDVDPSHSCGGNADADFFGSTGSGADARTGLALQLCERRDPRAEVLDAG